MLCTFGSTTLIQTYIIQRNITEIVLWNFSSLSVKLALERWTCIFSNTFISAPRGRKGRREGIWITGWGTPVNCWCFLEETWHALKHFQGCKKCNYERWRVNLVSNQLICLNSYFSGWTNYPINKHGEMFTCSRQDCTQIRLNECLFSVTRERLQAQQV
jgi:hypothetical protein